MSEDLEQEHIPSKSARKREMTALQKMGEELVGLSERELARMPLENENLERAIQEARKIRSNSALRRQLQYIGKLMRRIDSTAIADALTELHQQHQATNDSFHQLENLRDELLAPQNTSVEAAMDSFSGADRQHLRQLLKQHRREEVAGKAGPTSRKLFRYLRELADSESESESESD